jgi:hypothetical protein
VDILRKPVTCFDARLYAFLILSDPEEPAEVDKLESDVREEGLSLLVVADWHDAMGLLAGALADDNTHSRWFPVAAGSDVPALNTLLARFGVSFGLQAFQGSLALEGGEASGEIGHHVDADSAAVNVNVSATR